MSHLRSSERTANRKAYRNLDLKEFTHAPISDIAADGNHRGFFS